MIFISVLNDFVNGNLGVKSGLVHGILEQLGKISSWFERQTLYQFYGSSILIAYDAQSLEKGEKPEVRVRMIDFSHSLPNTEGCKDNNYAIGLEKLISAFHSLVK